MSSKPIKVGIQILNYNGADWLRELLPTLTEHADPDSTVYLLDNNSEDDSIEVFRQLMPGGKLIRMAVNCGFSPAYNLAIDTAWADNCDWVCLLNNDVRVHKSWIAPIRRLHDHDPNIGIIGTAFREWNGDGPNAFFRQRHPEHGTRLGAEFHFDTDWVEGSAMFIRRECWRAVGPFDPNYFIFWDETEYCRRARLSGYRVVVAMDSVVEHFGGGSVSSDSAFRKPLMQKNGYAFKLTDPRRSFARNILGWNRLLLTEVRQLTRIRSLNATAAWLGNVAETIRALPSIYSRHQLHTQRRPLTLTDGRFDTALCDLSRSQPRQTEPMTPPPQGMRLMSSRRVFLTVLDACGIGAMPDAETFNDPPGANTIGNVARRCGGLHLPNLAQLGLCELVEIEGTESPDDIIGSYGRVSLRSPGKDTTTGHWELAGIVLDEPFDVFPQGFPDWIIQRFTEATRCGGILANHPASGTAVIQQYHELHTSSGHPIVYTSADSVFQIACDVNIVPLETLYQWCAAARSILTETANVGRVIARPYHIVDGTPQRLSGERRDYAVAPPQRTILNEVQDAGGEVFAIGKIEDIFLGRGIDRSRHTAGNGEGIDATLQAISGTFTSDDGEHRKVDGSCPQLVFTNLVDTDALYGHRNNVEGFGQALHEIDQFVGEAIRLAKQDDLLIFVADHGCDPTVPGTDHTREYVPVLAYSDLTRPTSLGHLSSLREVGRACRQWLSGTAPGVFFRPISDAA